MVLASPGDHGMKVGLHVDDRRLTTAVGKIGVVRAMDDEQHDRSRAEVERDVVADMVVGVTGHREREPSLLDGRHANACQRTTSGDHRCIRQELARSHDRAEVVDVRDVEDLGAGRRRGHRTRSASGCCDCCPALGRAPAFMHRVPIPALGRASPPCIIASTSRGDAPLRREPWSDCVQTRSKYMRGAVTSSVAAARLVEPSSVASPATRRRCDRKG